MTFRLVSYKQLAAAMSLGLALRLFFIAHFPFHAGDTKFYDELARNWLDHGVYGLFVNGRLIPVDMRVPGYPAFLAGVYALFGRTSSAVMVVQAMVDLLTCVFAALIAARLAPASERIVVATVALWMAALCPFTANYSAVLLTEVLATFLTTLALLVFVCALGNASIDLPVRELDRTILLSLIGWWFLGGLIVGLGTLVRPDTPLVLIAVGVVLSVRWRRRANWSKLALAALWMGVGLLLPLTPWAVRNARTLGRVQFLAPRFAESYGDFIPYGFYSWTRTWTVRFGEAYLVPWKLGKEPIPIETLPNSAFDTETEHARVAALLSRYNGNLQMTPMLDHEFGSLARERTARRPLRTYVSIPLARAWVVWFTPRVQLLRYSGKLWPPSEKWRSNPVDFSATLGFGLLGFIYAGLALVGAWRCRTHLLRTEKGLALLVLFLAVRTAFLTQLLTVEPRYLIVCFPAVLAIGALAWMKPLPQVSLARRSNPSNEEKLVPGAAGF